MEAEGDDEAELGVFLEAGTSGVAEEVEGWGCG